jgi:hypothetical protein
MKLYVQYGDNTSNQWQKISELDLPVDSRLHPQQMAQSEESLYLSPQSIVLPNGECFEISASYSPGNRGMSINVMSDGKHLIHVGGFKYRETTYDPSVIFMTPKGLHLSLMVGQ